MVDCQDEFPLRTYGGVDGRRRKADRRGRFVDAGLELLGGAETAGLTVRGVCRQAGLATRYFYESFADRDELTRAVFDHAVGSVADSALRAVDAAGGATHHKIEAGVGSIVHTIAEDPRLGRLLFSTALGGELFAKRRNESTRLFVGLLGDQARRHYGSASSVQIDSQFVVGGFAQVLTAWLEGTLRLGEEALIEHCTQLFASVASRRG